MFTKPPPTQDLGQAVSSVNSYCTIILKYLVVRDINIISVKLKCLHPMFSVAILVWGMGDKLSRLVYLAPWPGFGSGSVISHSYCTIILEYLVVWDINIISIKLRCLHPMFSLAILVRGVGGKLSRLVYLAPCPGFMSGSVITQFLLHHYLGIFSCKRCEYYFSQTDMFTSNIQFCYPCPRGGGKLSRLVYLAPHQDLGQTVSSVNSYCTIILEYLVVRDVNIISVKLRCLHLMFSSIILVYDTRITLQIG